MQRGGCMSEIWHSSDSNAAQRPMNIPDLVLALSGMSNPTRVPVWRTGFSEWQAAGHVPEVLRL